MVWGQFNHCVGYATAQIVLIQEPFQAPYFCIERHAEHLDLAKKLDESSAVQRMAAVAKELSVVLPTSWFELAESDLEVHAIGDCVAPRRANNAFYEGRRLALKL